MIENLSFSFDNKHPKVRKAVGLYRDLIAARIQSPERSATEIASARWGTDKPEDRAAFTANVVANELVNDPELLSAFVLVTATTSAVLIEAAGQAVGSDPLTVWHKTKEVQDAGEHYL